MAIKVDKLASAISSADEPMDGEIYVRLGSKHLAWRTTLLFAFAAFAMSAALFAGFAEFSATTGGRHFSKGTTECPGMSPAQRIAMQTPHP